jgi:tRNA (guanine37-N1)-methyltransferase
MAVRFDIITIFPGMFSSVVSESIVGRAVKSGLVEINRVDLRDFTEDKHRSVDDRPYGGGPGMVFKPEPVWWRIANRNLNFWKLKISWEP